MSQIKCDGVNYRKGFIEVSTQIHDKHINIETWNIQPDVNISKNQIAVGQFNNDDVIGNTEIELSVEQAEILIKKLTEGINTIRNGS